MHLGKEAAARQALCEAWSLAQPDGILLPFAESDPCLDRLLDELAEGKPGSACIPSLPGSAPDGRPSGGKGAFWRSTV